MKAFLAVEELEARQVPAGLFFGTTGQQAIFNEFAPAFVPPPNLIAYTIAQREFVLSNSPFLRTPQTVPPANTVPPETRSFLPPDLPTLQFFGQIDGDQAPEVDNADAD